ncbi:MAG: hypothetical protein CHACPFDD_03198 [Phycisphaerae bacterium]|nr:hypothetical protein [Phycisphaerae bacterium]
MRVAIRCLLLSAVTGLVLLSPAGCSQDEKREVTVHEETHKGEVVEEKPGKMVVE